MQENSHSFCVWVEYYGEQFRNMAMEWDHRDREPCLSPAAFVNQVQYSNILEGRFKQLQGKSYCHVYVVRNEIQLSLRIGTVIRSVLGDCMMALITEDNIFEYAAVLFDQGLRCTVRLFSYYNKQELCVVNVSQNLNSFMA